MATITARKIDDDDYAALSRIAEENGRSLSEELRLLIAERVSRDRAERSVTDLLDFASRHPITLPDGLSSLDVLREERASW